MTWRMLLKRIFAVVAVILVMDVLLFVPAGRLDWPAAWALSLLYGAFLLAYAIWGMYLHEIYSSKSESSPALSPANR